MLPIILALLGFKAAAFIFDDGSDDAAPVDGDENSSGNDRDVTTEGDDVITSLSMLDDDDFGPDGELNLLGGDDILTVAPSFTTINGGDGNDTILDKQGGESTINGNAGEDTISASLRTNISGGTGDDVITYDTGDGFGDDGTPVIEGNDGDDTISVVHELGWNNSLDTSGLSVFGNSGSDTFVIELIDNIKTEDDTFSGTISVSDGSDDAQVTIGDFTSGEDTLIVDVSSFTANGNLEYTGADLNDEQDLVLSFMADGAEAPFTTTISLGASSEVSLDDITVVTESLNSVGLEDQVLSLAPGDDTFSTDDNSLEADTVEAGAGNDMILIDRAGFAAVRGGAGNDTITIGGTVNGLDVSVDGGAGDDTINALELSQGLINGGEGDDVINLTKSDTSTGVSINEHPGDDTYNLEIGVALQDPDAAEGVAPDRVNALNVFGWEGGEDVYNITLVAPTETDANLQAYDGSDPILSIPYFDPDEDQLVIDLPNSTGLTEVQSIETRVEEEGGDTELVITFVNAQGALSDAVINLGDQGDDFDIESSVTILLPAA